MAYRLGTAARDAAVNAMATLLNGGSIQIRTGGVPANVSDAAQGTLLATLTFAGTAFGSSSGGTATANAITSDSSVDASGTAGHARLLTSGGAAHSDCLCGQGTGEISFDNSALVAGGVCAISSMTLSQPVQ